MDTLIASFGSSSLGECEKKLEGDLRVFISEISSPTRLWIQIESQSIVLDRNLSDMGRFYDQHRDGFRMRPEEMAAGTKIAVRFMNQWDRAMVISDVKQESQHLKVFFYDYGTTGSVNLSDCRLLMEPFSLMSKLAQRGALHGIKPPGSSCLWNLPVTADFIKLIKDKVFHIKIIKHHPQEDFYEFLLYDTDGVTFNEKFINAGIAEHVNEHASPPPLCLAYPSFKMLETLAIYPTFGERIWVLERFSIDLNIFEENLIPTCAKPFVFEKELMKILKDPKFSSFHNIFLKLRGF